MVKIRIDQSLSNSSLYQHRFLENIKNLYKSAGKCYNHQQCKAILEAAVVSTTVGLTENCLLSHEPYEYENSKCKKITPSIF